MERAVRLLVRVVFVAAVWGCLSVSAATAQQFTVSAQSTQNYTINGSADPPLTLIRGQTYGFSVNTPGHPFFIKTVAVTGSGSAYNDGVTNNGLTNGILTFAVPLDAPAQLFYQCSVHAAMSGTITTLAPTPVPSSGRGWPSLLLTAALVALGCYATRRRAAAGCSATHFALH